MRFRYADGFSHARALAFQLVLALIPALITVVALARLLDQQTVTEVLTDTTQSIAPGPAGRLITQAFEQGSRSAGDSGEAALVLGLAVTLAVGLTCERCGTVATEVHHRPGDRPEPPEWLDESGKAS